MPLTNRADKISAFVTPDGLCHYKVMPFGMKNFPATVKCMVKNLIFNQLGCKA